MAESVTVVPSGGVLVTESLDNTGTPLTPADNARPVTIGSGGPEVTFVGIDGVLWPGGVSPSGVLIAGAGSYVWTGQNATLTVAALKIVAADAGSYAWAGADATPVQNHIIAATGSSYTYTGQDATLTKSGGALGLQTSLGAFYSLDNTLVDATGNMADLTNNNSVTFSSPGGTLTAVTNAAIFASASSKYLSVAAATAINMGATSFSIQLWYYNTGGGGAQAISKGVGFGDGDFQTGSTFTGGASALNFRSQHDTGTFANSGNQTQNTWHHYVYTYNSTGNVQFLYVDGTQVATNSGGSVPSGTGNLHIGASRVPNSYIDGRVALVGLWKGRVLTSGEASSLWNSGAGLSYAAMA